ncbi:MAG: dipeptidase [Pirellulales bacterium]|nr:dipeptidase [Pirellulales bacterium]
MPNLDEYLQTHADRFEQELCELLRIPSVSADPQHKGDVRRAGEWLAAQLQKIGLPAEVIDTDGHPLVYAQGPEVPGAPTALVYGHFDVQPVEPLDQWTRQPFEPAVAEGNVYARGASDDKGQLLTHIKSLETWLAVERRLPVNIKVLLEGEEEVGSESLVKYLAANREALACDCIVISDSGQFAPGQPAITCGLRGIAYYELRLRGPCRDLHSGSFGGTVTNPANALSRILASLIDDKGVVQIPGFYDDVVPLSDAERKSLAELPFDEAEYMKEVGVKQLAGEAGYTTLERRWARPTFDLCGLTSGYQGEGAKTVLPSRASAKLSFRLVANQDPDKITQSLRKHLDRVCPPGIEMELIAHQGSGGVLVSQDSPYMKAASRAIEQAFGVAPFLIREGGSIPVVGKFAEILQADVLLLGWGQDDDNTHAPNEKFCLADFHRGIKASTRLWEELAKLTK